MYPKISSSVTRNTYFQNSAPVNQAFEQNNNQNNNQAFEMPDYYFVIG